MKNKKLMWIGGLLVALLVIGVVGAVGIRSVYAQSGTTTPPPGSVPGDRDGDGYGHGRGIGQAELDAAAKALGMTTTDLTTALQSGKTLQQIASDKGVDFQTVQNAITTAHREELRTRIQQALSNGTISQDKANWLLQGVDKGYLDEPGFGFGLRGPHGPGQGQGQGFGPVPGVTPSAPQTQPAQPTQPTQQSSG